MRRDERVNPANDPAELLRLGLTRRHFLGRASLGLGTAALASLLGRDGLAATDAGIPHFAPTAKRVIYLFQAGGPSQLETLDPKPLLRQRHGEQLPEAVRGGQRLTGMSAGQAALPLVGSFAGFSPRGRAGIEMSDLLRHTAGVADHLCVVRSMHTEAINHDPAITFINTGNQLPGYASMGAWASYGLGAANADLPAFIVMVSQGTGKNPGQPVFSRLWGSGFLPSSHQGVGLRPGANPVLYLDNPPTVDAAQRRALLDDLALLNVERARELGDPETLARVKAYEMAFRMQTSVPELTDVSRESPATLAAYGPEVTRPGSYAANCLLARRLAERDVRFVQLFHRGWDQHIALARQLPNQCRDVDQPTAALVKDLKARGLLEDTLVVFATEFGRTPGSQGSDGRDHHIFGFSVWMAGGGLRQGIVHGATDEIGFHAMEHVSTLYDLWATVLHCLGVDHEDLTFRHGGRDIRLTDVYGKVPREILA